MWGANTARSSFSIVVNPRPAQGPPSHAYTYIYIYMCVYLHIHLFYVYFYIHIHIYMCIRLCSIYIFILRILYVYTRERFINSESLLCFSTRETTVALQTLENSDTHPIGWKGYKVTISGDFGVDLWGHLYPFAGTPGFCVCKHFFMTLAIVLGPLQRKPNSGVDPRIASSNIICF